MRASRSSAEIHWPANSRAALFLAAGVAWHARAFAGGAAEPVCAFRSNPSLHHGNRVAAANLANTFEQLAVSLHRAACIDRRFSAVLLHQLETDPAAARMSDEKFVQPVDHARVDGISIHAHAQNARSAIRPRLAYLVKLARIGDDHPRPHVLDRDSPLDQQWRGGLQNWFEFLKRFREDQRLAYAGSILERENRPSRPPA